MKVFMVSKEARKTPMFKTTPTIHIYIGKYCFDQCDYGCTTKSKCKLGRSGYGKILDHIVYWLWRHRIIGIMKESGKYSGTKHCPLKLDVIHTCDNCKFDGGYDMDCNGLCTNKNYHNMSAEDMKEDWANGLNNICRYWEPGDQDERLRH